MNQADLHGASLRTNPYAKGGGRLRIARLVRVSTTHVEQADSPQHQLAYIEGEVRRSGWQNTGLVYRAELTGAVILDRPDIQRMLADARAGRFDAIVLKSVSRLGRDTLGLLMVKRMLDDLQVELIALADGYRSGRDPELIFLVHAERAQAGRQEIAKNVRAGIVQAARRGIWPAGTLPFGLRKEGRFAIGPDPETSPLVRLIFQLRGRGWGLARICHHLNREVQARAPRWWHLQAQIRRLEAAEGAAQDERIQARLQRLRAALASRLHRWQPRTLRLILTNTAYRGELRYNRTTGQRRLHGRLVRAGRAPEDWVTIPCPALVEPDEWQAAQAVAATRRPAPRRGPAVGWLLTGVLVCGQCGKSMRGQAARGNTGGRGGDPKGYYVCRGSLEEGLHRADYVRAAMLEDAVLQQLRSMLAGVRAKAPLRRRGGNRQGSAAVEAELRDLAEARFYRRELLRKGELTPEAFAFESDLLAQREEALRAKLNEIPAAQPSSSDRERLEELVRLRCHGDDLKTLLRALVARVVVLGGDLAELHTHVTAMELERARVTAASSQPSN